MKHSSLFRTLVAIAAILVFVAGAAFAQTSNGTIAGVVTDASGAAVTNAKVTATATHTGEVRTTTTNSVGAYRFESLLPGAYNVEVNAQGFAITKLANVQVTASTVTSVNAALKVGGSTETVTVEANAETLQTESGEISHNISTAEISKLPISNLNAYSLATTLPGVVTTAGTVKMTNGTEFSVNGTRPRSNNFLIEGQDNNDAGIKGQGLQPNNLDAVKEVVVLTNSYAPEFGNGGGSVNNLIYKSGTNQFHGSAWEQHLNSFLNSNDKYDNYRDNPKSKFRENIFGFTVGGPVKKDKIFFFTSYQWDKYRSSTTGNTLIVPTQAGHDALVALLSAPTTTAAQKAQINTLLGVYGSLRGNNDSTISGYRNIALGPDSLGNSRGNVEVGSVSRLGIPNTYESPEFVSKGDIMLTSKDTLSLRYVRSHYESPYDLGNWGNQLPGFDTMQAGTAHNAGITYTRLFSNSLVNEARISYGRIGFLFDWRPEMKANPLAYGPAISIANMTGFGSLTDNPQGRFHNTIQYQDSLSWNVGTHSFKFGVDIADIRVRDDVPFNTYGTLAYGNSNYTDTVTGVVSSFTGLANFIDDFGGGSSASKTFGSPTIHPRMRAQNYFVQDAWKIRSNVTLTYGVRYEYQGTPANSLPFPAVNMQDMGAANYLTPVMQKPDKNNFGPRVGLAYTPHMFKKLFGEDKTVIRAGFGMFYDGMFTNILDNTAAAAPNAWAKQYISALSNATPRGYGSWSSVVSTLTATPSPKANTNPIDANLRNPETYQWNFDIQRDLPGNFTLTTGYIGTRGSHQFANTEANPIISYTNTGAAVRLYNDRARITVRDNENDSVYHGFNAKLDRRFSKGFQGRVAYTWSKMIDTGSEVFTGGNYSSYPVLQAPYGRGVRDRGLSAFDRRHAIAITYIYQTPTWKQNGDSILAGLANLSSTLVGGWEFSGTTRFQSGAPGNVQLGWDLNGDGISNDRPVLGNPNAPLDAWAVQVDPTTFCEGSAAYWDGVCNVVDPANMHWIAPTIDSRWHNYDSQKQAIGRNTQTLPWTQTWTIAASKNVKLTEKQAVQFRTEVFNPFNHGNTGIPDMTLTNTGSGFNDLPSTVTGYRDIRFMVKYTF